MSIVSRVIGLKSRAHFASRARNAPDSAPNGGKLQGRRREARSRVTFLIGFFLVGYAIIGGRLVQLAATADTETSSIPPQHGVATRPDILDRNGALLATDLNMVSLYAEPYKVVDVDEAVEKLARVIPNLDWRATNKKLTSKSRFQWLRRQLTPKQQNEIMALGIPGVGFRPEKRRIYPGGDTAAHILGYVDVDNNGVAGMERYIDKQGLSDLRAAGLTSDTKLEPVRLSIDIRVQNIVHDVVARAKVDYKAEAAGAVVIDVQTGEVLGMASVPDFDPNSPTRLLPNGAPDKEYEKGWMNRMSNSTYEMGSTFKSFTLAMGLDEDKITLNSVIDASKPIRMGGFTIKDFHGQYRPLTVSEIFQYSSNIGTASIADRVGLDAHREFLTRLGLLTKMQTELPEVATPSQPKVWKKINSATISFGHGVSTTPLQTAVAGAALVNGGHLVPPTFLPRSPEEAATLSQAVMKGKTSEDMRYLFHWNGVMGSGKNALVPGFNVGGKTGTADKVVNGRYAKDLNFNAFLAAFPIDHPRYVVLSIIDAPMVGENNGPRLAAYTAAPMVKEIIGRSASLLGVEPKFGDAEPQLLVNY